MSLVKPNDKTPYWSGNYAVKGKRKSLSLRTEIEDDAKLIDSLLSELARNRPERFNQGSEAVVLLVNECRFLGVRYIRRLGLWGNTIKVKACWCKLEQVMAKIKERGFGYGV